MSAHVSSDKASKNIGKICPMCMFYNYYYEPTYFVRAVTTFFFAFLVEISSFWSSAPQQLRQLTNGLCKI